MINDPTYPIYNKDNDATTAGSNAKGSWGGKGTLGVGCAVLGRRQFALYQRKEMFQRIGLIDSDLNKKSNRKSEGIDQEL